MTFLCDPKKSLQTTVLVIAIDRSPLKNVSLKNHHGWFSRPIHDTTWPGFGPGFAPGFAVSCDRRRLFWITKPEMCETRGSSKYLPFEPDSLMHLILYIEIWHKNNWKWKLSVDLQKKTMLASLQNAGFLKSMNSIAMESVGVWPN